MTSVRTRISALLAASTVVLLTGCGADVAGQVPVAVLSPGSEVPVYKAPTAPAIPTPKVSPTHRQAVLEYVDVEFCDKVWVAGKAFPTAYEGCFKNDGNTVVDASKSRCSSGFDSETHQTHEGRYWATLGGRVNDDPVGAERYAADVEGCSSSSR